jgi:hypothetical protein
MMGPLAYGLCILTALACAVLLARAYRATGARLLLWSALCFSGLAVSNALLIADLYIVPDVDLYWARLGVGFLSMAVLLYGLIWEAR